MDLQRFGFELSDEQQDIAQMARDFARSELAPGTAERDRSGEYPLDRVGQMAELGLLNMRVDPEDGGAGIDNVGYFLVMQAVTQNCVSSAVVLASSNLATSIVGKYGNKEQRERWVRPYAKGTLGPAAFALSEPHCGSDAAALTTRAVRDGDSYVLNGSKMWITSGAHAGITVVFAKTDPDMGAKGISAFVLEKGTPGLIIGKEEDKMGQRASGTVALHFENCRVPAENLLGEEGRGYPIALSTHRAGRPGRPTWPR